MILTATSSPRPLVFRTSLASSVSSRLIALFLTIVISLLGMIAVVSWQGYRSAIAQAETTGDNLSRALEQHAARTFEAIDLSLRIVQSRVQGDLLGNADSQTVHALMKSLTDASPQIRSIVVLDENGLIVQDSFNATPRIAPPATDRDYFIAHKDHPDIEMFVGPTMRNRINGLWSIAATKRISKADGSFAGVVLAIVDPEYFRIFYNSIDLGPNGTLALVDIDARVMVRRPWVDELIGRPLPQPEKQFSQLAEETGGRYERLSPVDGRQRLVAYRRLPKLPLVAVVTLDKADVIAAWRQQTLAIVGTALVVFFIIGLIGVLVRRALKRLDNSERLLNATLETMDQGLLMVSADERVQVYNSRVLGLLDLPAELMASKPSIPALYEYQLARGEFDEMDDASRAELKQSTGVSGVRKLVRRRPNGTMLEIRTAHMPDGGFVRTYTDLSDLIRAEDQVRESELRYRMLAETSSDVITRLNLDFKREYVSPGCRRLLGYEPEEMMGSQPSDAMHPEDAPAVRALAVKLVAGEIADELVTISYRTKHKLGHWIWVEAGMSLQRDEKTGRPTSLVCSLRDISLRKQAEAAIAESEARFRVLAENTSEMIILGSAESAKRYVSPGVKRILGFSSEEFLAMDRTEYVHPDDLEVFFNGIRELEGGKEQVTLTYRAKHKTRGWIPLEGSFRKVPGAKDSATAVVASFRDVSEREAHAKALMDAKAAAEKAQAEAERASQTKSDFLASMSHEIRTPLNGILGYTQLLLHEDALAGVQRGQVENIRSAGSALLGVVNDILDFSELEAGEISIQPHPFAIEQLLNGAASIVKSLIDKKSLILTVDIDRACATAFVGDQARLQQVLLNLLNNAVKFTARGCVAMTAKVRATAGENQTVRITVTDTGIGIAKSKQDRLFKKFSQVDGSIRREFGGTGLGLAISRHLIEMMGGVIGVDSAEGQGSSFWIELSMPVAEPPVAGAIVEAKQIASASATILVVEDVVMNQDIARAMLNSAGHVVDVARDGAEAVSAVQLKSYDLVFMDIHMAGMDGIAATTSIRGLDHPASRVPIIALSANVMAAQVASFEAAGMNGHVGKPFRREELLEAVARWAKPALDAPKIESDSPSNPLFDSDVYSDLQEMVGRDSVQRFLGQLAKLLTGTFDNENLVTADRKTLGEEAHKMAMAGMLGFVELSDLCAKLEQACQSNAELDGLIEKLRTTRDRTLAKIDDLKMAS